MKSKKNNSKDTYINDMRRRQGYVGGEPREQTISIRHLSYFQKGLLLYFFFCLYINDALTRKNPSSKQKDKTDASPDSQPFSDLTHVESIFSSVDSSSSPSLTSMFAADLAASQEYESQSSTIKAKTVVSKKNDIVSKTKMQKVVDVVVSSIKAYDLKGIEQVFKSVDVNKPFLLDGKEYTYLEYAVENENLGATIYFLEKGATIYAEHHKQEKSHNAIQIAITNKNNLLLRTLVDFDKKKTQQFINLPVYYLGEELTYISQATLSANLDAISVLLDAGADINHKHTLAYLTILIHKEMKHAITKSDFFKDLLKHDINCALLIDLFKASEVSKEEVYTFLFDIFKFKHELSGSKKNEVNQELNMLVFTYLPDYEDVWINYNGTRDRYLTRLLKYLQGSKSLQLSLAIDTNRLADEYAQISLGIPYDINTVFTREKAFTLLTYAIYKNHLADVTFILNKGADLVKDNQDALCVSILYRRIDILRAIIAQKKSAAKELINKYIVAINEDIPDKNLHTNGLYLATEAMDSEALSILMNQLKNPVIKKNASLFLITSIQLAINTENNELLKTILAFDKAMIKVVINKSFQFEDVSTTLIAEAISANNMEAVTLLLESGADINNKATLNALGNLVGREIKNGITKLAFFTNLLDANINFSELAEVIKSSEISEKDFSTFLLDSWLHYVIQIEGSSYIKIQRIDKTLQDMVMLYQSYYENIFIKHKDLLGVFSNFFFRNLNLIQLKRLVTAIEKGTLVEVYKTFSPEIPYSFNEKFETLIADKNIPVTLLSYAVYKNKLDDVVFLLSNHVDVEKDYELTATLIFDVAADNNHLDILNILLKHNKTLSKKLLNKDLSASLKGQVLKRNYPVIKQYLQYGADPCPNGSMDILELCLAKNDNSPVISKDDEILLLLLKNANEHCADFVCKHINWFESLLQRMPKDHAQYPTVSNLLKSTIYNRLSTAIETGTLSAMYEDETSAQLEFDINTIFLKKLREFTLLTYATHEGKYEEVVFLLEKGARLIKGSQDALVEAIRSERLDILQAMVGHKKNTVAKFVKKYASELSGKEENALSLALKEKNNEAITILLRPIEFDFLKDESLPVLAKALLIEASIENSEYQLSKFLVEQGHTYHASYFALTKIDTEQLSELQKEILSTAKTRLMHLKAKGKWDNLDTTISWQMISYGWKVRFEPRDDWTEYDSVVWYKVANFTSKILTGFLLAIVAIALKLRLDKVVSKKESNNTAQSDKEAKETKQNKIKEKPLQIRSNRKVFQTPDLNPITELSRLAADLKEKIKHMKDASEECRLALTAFAMEITETNIDELFPLIFENNKAVHRIFKVCKSLRNYCEETHKQLDEKINLLAKQSDLFLSQINSAVITSDQIDPILQDQLSSLEAARKLLQVELNALVIKQEEYLNKFADLNNAVKKASKVDKNSTSVEALKTKPILPAEEKSSAEPAPLMPISDCQASTLLAPISPQKTAILFFKPSQSPSFKRADFLPRECNELIYQILSVQDNIQYHYIFNYLQKALSTKDPLARGASANPICKATRFWIISLLAACYEAKLLRNEQLRHYFSHDNLRKEIRDVDEDRIYLAILCELEKLVKRFDFTIDSPKILVQQQMSRIVNYIDVTIVAVLKAEGLYNESTMQDYRKVISPQECDHMMIEMHDMFTRMETQAHESEIINNYERLLAEEDAPGLQLLNFMSDLITLGEQVRVLRAACKTQDGGAHFFNTECPRLIKIVQYRNNVCHNAISSLNQCLGLSADYHPSQFKKWFKGTRNQLQKICNFLEDNYLRPSQFELSK